MKAISILLTMFLMIVVSGCAFLMPSETKTTVSPWKDYEEARKSFDKITPYQTDMAKLKDLSFDPHRVPNTKLLDPLNIKNLFLSNPSLTIRDLPIGIQDCLSNFDACHGYEFKLENIKTKGTGNFPLRAFRFKEENKTTGTNISFKIFLVHDVVVYKLPPEGTPDINEYTVKKRPLGFLQDPADLLRDRVMPK